MNKKGIIYKTQKELYYVLSDEVSYKCKARGVFRDRNIKPLVGDYVEIQVLENGEGLIEHVLPRKSQLIRPPVANIDQILLVLTVKSPNVNYNLVDKYLVMLEHFGVDVVMVINKSDLLSNEDKAEFKEVYSKTGYRLIFTSAIKNEGIDELKDMLMNRISTLAGPSGVGKSTLLNLFHDDLEVETGDISKKTKRGKHTTRHTELFEIFENTFILDTPGFSSLDLSFIEEEGEIREFYPEFVKLQKLCRFQNCQHIKEPNCAVKEAIDKKEISLKRYENYLLIRDEIIKNRRF